MLTVKASSLPFEQVHYYWTLFVTSQYDAVFTFANQRLGIVS